ncbi:MAG: MFS transporter, partial [Thermoplasmata archaeon]
MAFFDYMDRSGLKPFHTKMQLLASMGMFLDGYDLSVITMAVLLIPHQLDLSKLQYILVNISAFIGMIIGAPMLGKLSDKIGRKKIFGIDILFFTIFAIISGLSTDFYLLFFSRFMLGIGIGGDYPISSTMVSEFSPSDKRGKMLFGMVGMYWLGALFSGTMNYAFAYTMYFWRYTFIIGGLISIPIIFLRMQIPESPRWLVSHGRVNEAESVVYTITGKYPDASEGKVEMNAEEKVSFRDLFRHRYVYITIFVLSVWFLFDVASYGIGFYYPLVISEIGLKSSILDTAGLRTIAKSSILISLGAIVGYLVALPMADRLGRRFLT